MNRFNCIIAVSVCLLVIAGCFSSGESRLVLAELCHRVGETIMGVQYDPEECQKQIAAEIERSPALQEAMKKMAENSDQ